MADLDHDRGAASPEAGGSGPALVIGVGAFGRDVLESAEEHGLSRPAPVRRRRVLLPLDGQEPDEDAATVAARVEGLLGLESAMQAEPGDERRPSLDIFVVGDLGDPEVAERLPRLTAAIRSRLARRFSNIFRAQAMPGLTVCPVVALLGLRDEGYDVAPAAAALSALGVQAKASDQPGPSPVARIFVVEQQTSHYELTRRDVVSTVVAFLTLVCGTSLRQQEPLRSFLRSSVEHTREGRHFASFGCATLELSLERYCVSRAAQALVTEIRAAASASVAEHAVTAQRLVPDPEAVKAVLIGPEDGEDLVAQLRAHTPRIDFPAIGPQATPEDVRDIAYGWGWFDSLEAAVDAYVKRLDEREMDEVSRVADERGLEELRRLQRDLAEALHDAETGGPHGWADALRLAEQVQSRAKRAADGLAAKLADEALPPFPETTTVESAFRELREESTLRPRPPRMRVFTVIFALVMALLTHHLPKWFAVCILDGRISPFAIAPPSMGADVGGYRYLLDPPYAFFWCGLLAGGLLHLYLERRRKKRHAALLAAQDDLRAAVRRYLSDDVGPSIRRYYETRLAFSLSAWTLRMLRRIEGVAAREVQRLARISTALDRLERVFAAEAERAERGADEEGGDLVYRTHLSRDLLVATYEASRPGADLAARLFEDIGKNEDPRAAAAGVPPYLFESRLRDLVRPFCVPRDAVIADLAGDEVKRFVERRHGRLRMPLEIRGPVESANASRYVFAPSWARDGLDALRQELRTLPEIQVHEDGDRVHLVTLQTALTEGAIVLPDRGGKRP